MAMVAAFESERTESDVASTIAHVEVLGSLAEAQAVWEDLQGDSGWATPFQRFAFLSAWQSHIGAAEGFAPLVVVARDAAGRPLLLLPLAVRSEFGVRCARFMGGKHATFNAPVARRTFAAAITRADLDALLAALRAAPARVDLLVLEQQPVRWEGLQNPMQMLPSRPTVNTCPLLPFRPGDAPTDRIKNSVRRFLRNKKERKLQALPGYRHLEAESDADIARILDAFFHIKPQRMTAQGLPDIFSDPGTQRFIRDACHARLPSGGRAIVLHALECDDEVLAIFAGVADGRRFSTMFGTYTMSENARHSPGRVLVRVLIDHYAERGYTGFDLGIGDGSYKHTFCKDDEPLFDSFVGLSARGTVAAAAMAQLAALKRRIKQSPRLTAWATRIRGLGRAARPQADD